MKELNSFTVEAIEEIISSCQQEIHNTPTSDEFPVSPRLLLSLARIALAAKRAEPVINIKFKDGWPVPESVGVVDAGKKLADGYHDFYTIPQLNSPQMPEGWIKCSDQMPEDDQVVVIINSGHGFLYEAAVVTRRGPHFDLMDGLEASNYDGGAVVRLDMEATHWMQLPAAPEKENG